MAQPPKHLDLYTGNINPTTGTLQGVAVAQVPSPSGLAYVFYWDAAGNLSYLSGNRTQGGYSTLKDNKITINGSNILNGGSNAPLAAALTSDGIIHVFYPDSLATRTLLEIIYNPTDNTWAPGSLNTKLTVHNWSGISVSSAPVLKVNFQSVVKPDKISEVWYDPSVQAWKELILS